MNCPSSSWAQNTGVLRYSSITVVLRTLLCDVLMRADSSKAPCCASFKISRADRTECFQMLSAQSLMHPADRHGPSDCCIMTKTYLFNSYKVEYRVIRATRKLPYARTLKSWSSFKRSVHLKLNEINHFGTYIERKWETIKECLSLWCGSQYLTTHRSHSSYTDQRFCILGFAYVGDDVSLFWRDHHDHEFNRICFIHVVVVYCFFLKKEYCISKAT